MKLRSRCRVHREKKNRFIKIQLSSLKHVCTVKTKLSRMKYSPTLEAWKLSRWLMYATRPSNLAPNNLDLSMLILSMVLRKTVSSAGVSPSKMAAILITFWGWHDTSLVDRSRSNTKMTGDTKKMSRKSQGIFILFSARQEVEVFAMKSIFMKMTMTQHGEDQKRDWLLRWGDFRVTCKENEMLDNPWDNSCLRLSFREFYSTSGP